MRVTSQAGVKINPQELIRKNEPNGKAIQGNRVAKRINSPPGKDHQRRLGRRHRQSQRRKETLNPTRRTLQRSERANKVSGSYKQRYVISKLNNVAIASQKGTTFRNVQVRKECAKNRSLRNSFI
ncbi:mannitol 1-phosphate dehydrogenase [Lasius niger]|uniref:Mannitol 1-phosphate dehydrogenase n=1 Tax=Lasius niger TaxID=67767 RepID=A0A0J7K7D4_LASNI|nr:mannitol 1-phosphate dehydrogenase [Lasius niger]